MVADPKTAKLEAVQRSRGCNQDNEPSDWGRPCCSVCVCAAEASGRTSMKDLMSEERQPETAEPRGCPTPGACSALTEIERLRAGLLDVRKFLSNPEWGTTRYMEGSGVYEDKDQALFVIAYALGETEI